MGKVSVIIEAPFLSTDTLYELTQAMIPSEDDWHTACLQFTGAVPEEIKIIIKGER